MGDRMKKASVADFIKKLNKRMKNLKVKLPKLKFNINKNIKTSESKSSIKTQIFIRFISLILVVVILLGGLSAYENYKITFKTLENTMINIAQVSSNAISNKLEIYKTVATDLGLNPLLTDQKTNNQTKSKLVAEIAKMYNLVDAFTVTDFGRGESPVTRELYMVSDMDYFQAAMEGKVFLSEPVMNPKFEKYTLTVAAPIWKDGVYDSTISGVAVIVLDGQALSDIAKSVKIGEGGYGFILNKDGLTIGHPDYEKVIAGENVISSYENDGSNESLAKTEKKLLNGEISFGDYSLNNQKSLISYAPIAGSNDWGFFVSSPQAEYLSSTYISLLIMAIVSIISLIVAYIVGKKTAAKIADPIITCANRLNDLANGDLHTEVEMTKRNDEIGVLIKSLSKTIKGFNVIVNDISYHLGAIADSDFSQTMEMEYNGDFNSIATSMKKISNYLNVVVRQVNESAEQVSSGSEQVASGAQALSQSTTEQASSVEELNATINDVSEQIKSNAAYANNANDSSLESLQQVKNSNNYVKEMNSAMLTIKDTSSEISKIIKVIDEIAFQTNILALNAAIEAARAGTVGKGFAVVADEVRNLALKSAEAANKTKELVENSIIAVNNGAKISKQADEALNKAVEKVNAVSNMIEEISNVSSMQATSISQILFGMEQVSAIVQSNSATAEQSAAASQELSSQAQVLKDLVGEIKLKESATVV